MGLHLSIVLRTLLSLESMEDWRQLSEGRQGYNNVHCPETSGFTGEILFKRKLLSGSYPWPWFTSTIISRLTLWQVSFLERETLPRIKWFRWNFTSFLFWTKWFRNVLRASRKFICFLSNFFLPSQTNLHIWPNQWKKLFSDDIILSRIASELYPNFASFCGFKQFYLFHG